VSSVGAKTKTGGGQFYVVRNGGGGVYDDLCLRRDRLGAGNLGAEVFFSLLGVTKGVAKGLGLPRRSKSLLGEKSKINFERKPRNRRKKSH